MALKLRYKSQEEIPAEARSLYAAQNNEWTLDVEGAVPAEALHQAQQQAQELDSKYNALHAQLTSIRTEEAAVAEAVKAGLKATAITDLRYRARNDLVLEDGKPARRGPDGKSVPVNIGDWVKEQARDAAHLFEQSSGSGAAGVRSNIETFNEPNPFAKRTWNLTNQAKLVRSNPELAKQLEAQARAQAN